MASTQPSHPDHLASYQTGVVLYGTITKHLLHHTSMQMVATRVLTILNGLFADGLVIITEQLI